MSTTLSTYTLTMIAIDRYFLIVHPTSRWHLTPSQATIAIFGVFTVAAAIAAPYVTHIDMVDFLVVQFLPFPAANIRAVLQRTNLHRLLEGGESQEDLRRHSSRCGLRSTNAHHHLRLHAGCEQTEEGAVVNCRSACIC